MTDYGVISTGFSKKDLSIIVGELEDEQRENIKQSLNLLATSVLGQINGIVGDKLREMWDLGQANYNANYPSSANDQALDEIGDITKTPRLDAAHSTGILDRIYLENGTTVPSGSITSVGVGGVQFQTTADVSNVTGFDILTSVEARSVDEGPVVGLSGNINTIVTPISGWLSKAAILSVSETFALVNGQTLILKIDKGTEQTFTFSTGDFVDINNATATEVANKIDASISEGEAYNSNGFVWIISDETGPTSAVEITGGTANGALGFTTGIIEGMNSLDFDLGRNIEGDPAYRARRVTLLMGLGKGNIEAIRAALLNNDVTLNIEKAFVFQNKKKVTVDGIPPSAVEAVVLGGLVSDIADTLFIYGGGGIELYGNTTASVVDSMGNSQDCDFSRPVEEDIYIDVSLDITTAAYPADGDDQVKAALVLKGDAINIGEDIVALQFKKIPLEITGVNDVTSFKIDTVFPPVNTANIDIVFRNLAVFDTSRIRIV